MLVASFLTLTIAAWTRTIAAKLELQLDYQLQIANIWSGRCPESTVLAVHETSV